MSIIMNLLSSSKVKCLVFIIIHIMFCCFHIRIIEANSIRLLSGRLQQQQQSHRTFVTASNNRMSISHCYIHNNNLRKYQYNRQATTTTRFMTYLRNDVEQNTLQQSQCYRYRNQISSSLLPKSQWMKKERSSSSMRSMSSTSGSDDVVSTTTDTRGEQEKMGDRLVSLQKEISGKNFDDKSNNNMFESSAETIHIQHQQQVFDKLVSYFTSDDAVPINLIPVYEYMTKRIFDTIEEHHIKKRIVETNSTTSTNHNVIRILDVGCGTGVLWEFLSNEANKRQQQMTLHITGIDLTNGMVKAATNKASLLNEKYSSNNKHTFKAIQDDIASYNSHSDSLTNDNNNLQYYYDIIIINACFGNFYNPRSVLDNISKHLIKDNSLVFITHPLGGQFVNKLHNEDPITVPHTLPSNIYEWMNLSIGLPYEVLDISTNDITLNMNNSITERYPFYFTSIMKTRATMLLDNIMKFRGNVDTGYGRGGKKLGFPTANLPSSLFQKALQNISNGVYFGYTIIEDNNNNNIKQGRNVVHPVVVNIGYSPTFVGQENREKIIEAHLIIVDQEEKMTDFYGETMRLVLLGFLRYEMKFASFPELIQQIQNDVNDAKHALTSTNMPYIYMKQNDPFLSTTINDSTTSTIICLANGTLDASYEFESTQILIRKLQDMWKQHS